MDLASLFTELQKMDLASLFTGLHVESTKYTNALATKFQSELGPVEAAKTLHKFLHLESLEEMFTLFWDLPAAHRCLVPVEGSGCGKNEEASDLFRTEGNNRYRMNDLEGALKLYNLCIMMAPHPNLPQSVPPQTSCNNDKDATAKPETKEAYGDKYKTLACGYGNRSAVFLRMKDYDKCLADIDRALQYSNSSLMKEKLLDRKERCLKAQTEDSSKDIEPMVFSLNGTAPPVLAGRSRAVPAFSSVLKVANSPKRGRHIVATRDIPPGEVLAVEQSYCSFVTFNHTMLQACSVCLMNCEVIIPCPNCMIAFCSEKCRDKGLKELHGKECKIIPYIFDMDLDQEILLALRLVIHTTFIELKEKWPVLQKESKQLPPEKLGFDENGVYSSSDYRSVYHMTAYNSRKPNKKLYSYCQVAFVLTKILHESKAFFVDRSGSLISPSREDFILTGAALLYHLAHINKVFQVIDAKLIPGKFEQVTDNIGMSLFPSIWLIKHACNANAAHYNMGQKRVVRSVMSIPAGSEVTLQFSEGFQHTPLINRIVRLQLRGIECSCQACMEDWPTEGDMDGSMRFKCITCSKPVVFSDSSEGFWCRDCNVNYRHTHTQHKGKNQALVEKFWHNFKEVTDAGEGFRITTQKMIAGKRVNRQDFVNICDYVVAIEKYVVLPCLAFCKTRDIMIRYFFLESFAT